jgi:hypothetical protein
MCWKKRHDVQPNLGISRQLWTGPTSLGAVKFSSTAGAAKHASNCLASGDLKPDGTHYDSLTPQADMQAKCVKVPA